MAMSISVKAVTGRPNAAWGEAVVVPVFKGKGAPRGGLHGTIDRALRGALADLEKLGEFTGAGDEIHLLYSRSRSIPARVLLLGLGEPGKCDEARARKAGFKLARKLRELKLKKVTLGGVPEGPGLDVPCLTGAVVEGVLLGSYTFEDFKTKDARPGTLRHLQVAPEDKAALRDHNAALHRIAVIAGATAWARDLANRPCNDIVPQTLAAEARTLATGTPLKLTVLDGKKAEALGMHLFCGVARGSAEPPAFIVLEYNGGPKGEKPVVLVGKGLTFDTGGISLKPAENMDFMKYDMCGAAAVLGTMKAVVELQLPINIVMLVPSVENMPGGRAYKPGDVLKSLGGLTVEVRNTDAEGRLVLADALAYAERFQPAAVIDLATLTGGCVVALGSEAAGLFSADDDLAWSIVAAGEATGDRCWRLPIWDEYRDMVKSDVADLRNSAGRWASAITGACFLEAFATKYRWAHLDIAGTAYMENGGGLFPKGATGFGVRLLVRLLTEWAQAGGAEAGLKGDRTNRRAAR